MSESGTQPGREDLDESNEPFQGEPSEQEPFQGTSGSMPNPDEDE